jgi:4-amino-4-deoxy-L-arabinose transferase-like glycosyltransferase
MAKQAVKRVAHRAAGTPTPSVDEERGAALEQWLRRRRLTVGLFILGLAIAVRVTYFVQADGSPVMAMHRWSQSDMNYFHAWAQQITAGDLLSRHVEPPLHHWHLDVAQQFLKEHPDQARTLLPAEFNLAAPDALDSQPLRDAAKALWNRWSGEHRFYQDPLYPYLVALTFALVGEDVRWVFAWQLALGALAVLLVWLIARRCFGETVGVAAGLIAALYGPMMFYDMILLRETLITLAGLLIVWLWMRAIERPVSMRWLLTGAALGAGMMLKSQFLLLLVAVIGRLAISGRLPARQRLVLAGLLVAGALAVMSPMIVRNLTVGVGPMAMASSGATNVILANAEDAGAVDLGLGHVAEILERTRGATGPTMIQAWLTHGSVGSLASLYWERFATLWNWFEIPNNENFYFYGLHAPVLRWMPFTFATVGPLGLVGMALAIRRWGQAGPLYVLVLVSLAAITMFFPYSRLRLPMVVAMIPFAGFSVVQMMRWLTERRWVAAALSLVGIVVLGSWIWRPIPFNMPLIRIADHGEAFNNFYMPQIRDAVQRNDLATAARVLGDALHRQADQPAKPKMTRKPMTQEEKQIAKTYSGLYAWYAELLRRLGRADEAAAANRRAVLLNVPQ